MARNRHPGELPASVLDIARRRGTVTRLELAEELSVTPATITNVVKRLLRDGLLTEDGHRDSTGGKRASILRVKADSRFAIGIGLGFTSLTAVLTDFQGRMVGQTALPLNPYDPADHPSLSAGLDRFLRAMEIERSDVVGVGLASRPSEAGGFDPEVAQVAVRLEAHLGLRVVARDEAACAAIGESWSGGADEDIRFATIYMAEHFTASVMDGGRLVGSPSRGSIGHMSVDHGGPACPCGSRGCLNVLASPSALVQRASARPRLRSELQLDGGSLHRRSDFAKLSRAAVGGHADALTVVEEAAEMIGWVVVDIAALLGLDAVYLAGPGFTGAGAVYERVVRETTRTVAGPAHRDPVRVQLSLLDQDAAALGAASLATQATMTQVATPTPD